MLQTFVLLLSTNKMALPLLYHKGQGSFYNLESALSIMTQYTWI